MKTKVVVLYVHGMGNGDNKGYSSPMTHNLKKELGVLEDRVAFREFNYGDSLSRGKSYIKERLDKVDMRNRWLRRALLDTLGDPATILNNSGDQSQQSLYWTLMIGLGNEIEKIKAHYGNDIKITIVSHSLGCQLVSCFIWDCQKKKPYLPAAYHALPNNVRLMVTMGCNIPLFILDSNENPPFESIGQDHDKRFRWVNYYSRYDVLAYPLSVLGEAYRRLVEDVPVRFLTLGGIINPHTKYWKSKTIAAKISDLLIHLL